MSIRERLRFILGDEKISEISEFVAESIKNKGITNCAHNQLPILPVSDEICKAVFSATAGHTDISGKRYAFEASKLYHEFKSHNNAEKENARGQIVYSEEDIFDIVECMIRPDIVEDVSHGDVLDQRNVFALVRTTEKCVVVILSVGGKRNPNVTPQQIIFFKKEKWDQFVQMDVTIREILYGDSKRRYCDPAFLEIIKKNRVTVAHHES